MRTPSRIAHAGPTTSACGSDGDDPYAYQVEVTLPNGEAVTVELDEAFKVTKIDR